jgi:glutathione S-transferase
VKTWEALADGLCDAAILVRLERTWAGRKAKERSEAWIERQMGKVHGSLKAMSQGLGERPYCAGTLFSLADVAVGCALGYLDFRFPEINWREAYPNLAKLGEKLATRASFAETRPT